VEERRRNDDTRIEVLTERVSHWMESTTEYRKSLCAKNDHIIAEIEAIKKTLAELPCPQRMEQTKGIKFQLNALWWIVALLITSSFGLAVAWGSLTTTVERNTAKWDAHDQAYGVVHGERN
jgi:hypothetical protein